MYHLFYGDGAASTGSDLTVFDLPHAAREHRGNNSISRTTFRIHGDEAFEFWEKRLDEQNVDHRSVTIRDGRTVLDFDDPLGTALSLVEDGGEVDAFPWDGSPVPAGYQVRGLGYVEITVPAFEPTDQFLTGAIGLHHDHTYPFGDAPQFEVHVYIIGRGGAHAEIHVLVRDDLPRANYGSGGVHHVALRVPEAEQMSGWVEKLGQLGYHNSGIVNRHYFRSIYVREPNGVLFELATDGPGFFIDGPIDAERLSLPPFLEPNRLEIESALKPLTRVSASEPTA